MVESQRYSTEHLVPAITFAAALFAMSKMQHFPTAFLEWEREEPLGNLTIALGSDLEVGLQVLLSVVLHRFQCQPRLRDDAHLQRNGASLRQRDVGSRRHLDAWYATRY